ncbi:MAG: acetate kinase [Bacteroidales bacterium]|nr:acetate kinase [Bacteroidales bacterium]MCF8388630.1 acetate kinase [Bacteroidales bacterium]MCF8397399.1 acetate kinase [Bacteroidales bacterium]
MKILVLNCGSSSIKYQLFNIEKEELLAKGLVEKVGLNGSALKNKRNDGDEVRLEGEILDHQQGIEYILGVLTSEEHGSLKSLEEIDAVGHRVVHGGEKFNSSVLITDEVIKKMEECIDLAPLHNPPNLKGIYSMKRLLPDVPQAGVFDTAFHQSMPEYSYMYAIPYSLYKKYGLRRYGFHGTSHRYVSKRACAMLDVNYEDQKIITCHLGNGSSIAAIKNGKSLDTSMGLTPVEGLMMGTRTGDLDLGVLLYIMEKEEIGTGTANKLINKHSGVLGVSGVSSDMREIENAAAEGNERAKLSLNMFHYRIRKYIGAYAAAMGGVDILVFTGGIGENGQETREAIMRDFEYLGLTFDQKKNHCSRGKEEILSTGDSKVKALVVPTNEELVIARDTFEIVR